VTRRRAFWPGQGGRSVPPGFLGDDEGGDGERRRAPAVRWRAVDRPLYPDDVQHGPPRSSVDDTYSASSYVTSTYVSSSYASDESYAYDGAEGADEPDRVGLADDFARYDRYGRFDDHYLVDDDVDDGYRDGDGFGRYEVEPDVDDGYRDGNGFGRYEVQVEVEADVDDGYRDGDGFGRYQAEVEGGIEADWYDSERADHGTGADWYDSEGAGQGAEVEAGRRPVGLYRFDDLAPRDDDASGGDVDPTEPLGEVLRDAGRRQDPGAVLRDILVDRDDLRVEPGRRGPRGRWRLALAERLVKAWPGQSGESAPPGFPASGELVLHPRRPTTGGTLVRLPVRDRPVVDDDPIFDLPDAEPHDAGDAADPGDLDDLDDVVGAGARVGRESSVTRGRFGGPRPAGRERSERGSSVPGLPSPRSLQKVAMAVYAALADPIVNADPEARERRTLQVRRFGLVAGSAALAVVLIYAIFPVRTYLEQRAATQRARERIDKLSEANAELERRKEELRDDETVEEIARREYQLVFPGEESYGLLPPPVPPTTTTTTPPGG
jgi:cell division protein FtsB